MQTKPVLRHRIILFVQDLNCQLYMLFFCGIMSCLFDRLSNLPRFVSFVQTLNYLDTVNN